MKKLLNFFIVVSILFGISVSEALATTNSVSYHPGDVTNLSITTSSADSLGNVTATFIWQTYKTTSSTSITLEKRTTSGGPLLSAGGGFCQGDEDQGQQKIGRHCFYFPNLASGSTYHYQISGVAAETGVTSGDITIQSNNILYPGRVFNLATASYDDGEKSIKKGDSATYQFQFANTGNFDDSYQITTSSSSSAVSASLSASSVNGLKAGFPSDALTLTVTATSDSSSNQSVSGNIVIKSNNDSNKLVSIPFKAIVLAAEVAAPSQPTNLRTTAISQNYVSLAWTGSSSSSVTYDVYRATGGSAYAKIATAGSASYTDTGLTAGTDYVYIVQAKDTNGNVSAYSAAVAVRTLASSNVVSPPSTVTPPPPPPPSPTPSPVPPSSTVTSPPPSSTTDTTSTTTNNLTREVVSEGPVLLQGRVVYPSGQAAAGALISIWASSNSTAQVNAGSNGEFSFQVARNSTWRLSASKTNGNIGYRSNDITVQVENQTVTGVEISLVQLPSELPPSTTTQRTTIERITTTLTNGTTIDIPPSTISVSGNVTLSVMPTVEVHEYSTNQVVGLAYDIVLKDQVGAEIKTFATPIDIIFPYDDTTLVAAGVTVENLTPSYYDEALKQWVTITNFTVDRINKRIVAKVSHLTRFALIAAADVTPPASPIAVTAKKVGANVILTWTPPANDFRHAKIYRSSEAGKLGTVLFAEVAGNSQTDTTTNGTIYYYVVRAVDPAGNESANTNQVTFSSSAGTAITYTGSLGRSLRVGMSGNDVRIMQQILVRDGVYLEAFITGYFGRYTEKAVLKFQEKYKAEILTPIGLTAGNGFVGPRTIKKLIELKAQYSL